MVLVAVAMVAMIAMAALSIDLVTLYLDREEAQRSADLAALTAARVLSLTGVTGDPSNSQNSWTTVCPLAQQAATTIANQNNVAQTAPTSVVVTFIYNNGGVVDCSAPSAGFAVNPQVQVQVIRQSLPVFFSRIWSRATNSVSATAVAEAYNPSGSGGLGSGSMVPVSPRCVKPWIVPNLDPNTGKALVGNDGSIKNAGVSLNNTSATGVIGELFQLVSTCSTADCTSMAGNSVGLSSGGVQYMPALVNTSAPSVAVPSCANSTIYQQGAMAGCDQTTNYACGVPSGVGGVQADLTQTPRGVNGTSSAAQCLIHQGGNTDTTGQDSLDTSGFPFQIKTGDNNPMFGAGLMGTVVSVSNSIITVPIFDSTAALPPGNTQPPVTIVGFLQLFIDNTDSVAGTINTHVLNVAGCSTNATNNPVNGSSPVPVRLITPQ